MFDPHGPVQHFSSPGGVPGHMDQLAQRRQVLCSVGTASSVLSKKHISLSFYVWCHTWENRARESLPHGFGLTNVASNGNAVSVKNSLLPLLPSALLYVWLH